MPFLLLLLGLGAAGYAAVMRPKAQAQDVLREVTVQATRRPVTQYAQPELTPVTVTAKRRPVTQTGGGSGSGPRGIRNNNPGNIEYSPYNDWRGQVGSDGRYVIFSDAVYGIRAMARILKNYRARGVVTLRDIINTWAPDFENNTSAYLKHVVQRTGLNASAAVEGWQYPALIDAIILHENGVQPYSNALIYQGVEMA